MSLKIIISDKVRFKVSGKLKNESGGDDAFAFDILAKRISTETLSGLKDTDQSIADFIADVALDWFGVQDADGAPLEFSAHALRQLLGIAGMATFIFAEYIRACGPREKN